ncbi:MAG: NYN domain-containing protein [Candidatus Sungbacteria bacterium]|nr:NYN domain-containing protein [Candidatus Sungbacteria bacterium]
MPRGGRPPTKQITVLAGIVQQNGRMYHRDNVDEKLRKKLFKHNLVEEYPVGYLRVTEAGKDLLLEAGKSAMILVDFDNVEYQAREQGTWKNLEEFTAFLRRQALLRNFLFDGAAKFCFLTTKSGGTEALAAEFAMGFLQLGFYVNMVQPAPNAADKKMKEMARCAILNPSIKTVFIVSHDTGFVSTMKALLEKKKTVVPIMVDKPSPKMQVIHSQVVQIEPSWTEMQRFKKRVKGVLLFNNADGEFEKNSMLAALVAGIAMKECEGKQLPFQTLLRRVVERINKSAYGNTNGFGKWHYRIMLQIFVDLGIVRQVVKHRFENGRKITLSKYYVFKKDGHELAKGLLERFAELTENQEQEPREEAKDVEVATAL